VQPPGRGVVCPRRFDLPRKVPEELLPPAGLDRRAPHLEPLAPPHAFVPRPGIAIVPPVEVVLGRGAVPQVGPPIVQAVVVDVVADHPSRRAQDLAMHPDLVTSPAIVARPHRVERPRGPHVVPAELRQPAVILGIDLGEAPARQRNPAVVARRVGIERDEPAQPSVDRRFAAAFHPTKPAPPARPEALVLAHRHDLTCDRNAIPDPRVSAKKTLAKGRPRTMTSLYITLDVARICRKNPVCRPPEIAITTGRSRNRKNCARTPFSLFRCCTNFAIPIEEQGINRRGRRGRGG